MRRSCSCSRMPRTAASPAPFADAIAPLLGRSASTVIALFAAISALGCVNGWVLVGGRDPAGAGPRRRVPGMVREDDQDGTPVRAQIVGAGSWRPCWSSPITASRCRGCSPSWRWSRRSPACSFIGGAVRRLLLVARRQNPSADPAARRRPRPDILAVGVLGRREGAVACGAWPCSRPEFRSISSCGARGRSSPARGGCASRACGNERAELSARSSSGRLRSSPAARRHKPATACRAGRG